MCTIPATVTVRPVLPCSAGRQGELHGLTLLHHDRDFGVIARVTGQPLRWYGPGAG
jgi:hypothetical protein